MRGWKEREKEVVMRKYAALSEQHRVLGLLKVVLMEIIIEIIVPFCFINQGSDGLR